MPTIPTIRILPMSDKLEGFVGLTIVQVQKRCFLRDLHARRGRFRYRSAGLNAPAGSVILFQFKSRIIASAVFLRDERFARPIGGCRGQLHLDGRSVRTFDPLDIEAMRKVWPGMRPFGHVKQFLNPTSYPAFKRRLKNVASPRAAGRTRGPRQPR